MNKSLSNAFASAEMEGFTFTEEQKKFIVTLTENIERGDITWGEAVAIIKERYNESKDT